MVTSLELHSHGRSRLSFTSTAFNVNINVHARGLIEVKLVPVFTFMFTFVSHVTYSLDQKFGVVLSAKLTYNSIPMRSVKLWTDLYSLVPFLSSV